jgi:ABC-type spermidine/putrescine transport system permease subunit II
VAALLVPLRAATAARPAMGRKGPAVVLSAGLPVVQVLCALFLLGVTPWKLFKGSGFSLSDATTVVTDPNATLRNTTKCLLDPGTRSAFLRGSSFCIAVMTFAVASLILGAIISCAKCLCRCVTANVCGLSNVVTVVADLAMAVAWCVAFVMIFQRGQDANAAGFPQRGWRDGVTAAAAFGTLDAIVMVCAVGPS